MNEALETKVRQVLVEWHQAGLCPRNLLNEDHNANELFTAVYAEAVKYQGQIDVADVTRMVMSLGDIDRGGRLRYHKPAVQQRTATTATEAPWKDEPMLRKLTSLVAVAELTAAQAKMFCNVAAMHEYDEHGRKVVSLNQKFNERVAWLKDHPDVVLDFSEPQQPQTVVVRKRVEEPRVTVIREQIERESKGYTDYAHRKGERLNAMLNELLCDPSRQIYRDRSRGGIEVIKGLDAVERIMAEKIRDYDSPLK